MPEVLIVHGQDVNSGDSTHMGKGTDRVEHGADGIPGGVISSTHEAVGIAGGNH